MENTTNFCFYPIRHHSLHKYYQEQQQSLWAPSEIEFFEDRKEWESLDDETKEFIRNILGFFACADGIVGKNIIDNFKSATSFIKEADHFYSVQGYIECVHGETYSLFIEAFINNEKEKLELFNSINTLGAIKPITEWMLRWMDPSAQIPQDSTANTENTELSLPERIIAFACVEGIFFYSAFAAIYFLKKRNILKGMTKANEWIARDENLHVKFAVNLYQTLLKHYNYTKPTQERVQEIVRDAVSVACLFTRESLKADLIGLNADEMVRYIKSSADDLLKVLEVEPIYNEVHGLDWMMAIGLSNKSNFFECNVTEYKALLPQLGTSILIDDVMVVSEEF